MSYKKGKTKFKEANKMIEKNRLSLRFNDEIEKKLQELLTKYPDDFKSRSQVFRAGVMALYRERVKGGD